jgi:hypothetical protein
VENLKKFGRNTGNIAAINCSEDRRQDGHFIALKARQRFSAQDQRHKTKRD